jgi:RNase P/RNase MRP subunit POP5
MYGNFEIVPRVVTLNGNRYIVEGYRENAAGVKTAVALYKNSHGKRIVVKNEKIQIALIRKIEYENKKISKMRNRC